MPLSLAKNHPTPRRPGMIQFNCSCGTQLRVKHILKGKKRLPLEVLSPLFPEDSAA